jgi:hypothetical protein
VTERHAPAAAEGSSAHDATAGRPLLSVVRGAPTPEQLAALVAVLTARASAGDGTADAPAPSLWSQPQLRAPLATGPGAWRASALPR